MMTIDVSRYVQAKFVTIKISRLIYLIGRLEGGEGKRWASIIAYSVLDANETRSVPK